MQARSTSPSSASCRHAAPRSWRMDCALAADSIRPSSTSACAVRRCSDRRVQASARAAASLGVTWRSRWGEAAAAGSTVRTPITSPSTGSAVRRDRTGCPARRTPCPSSVGRRPGPRRAAGRRMTAERKARLAEGDRRAQPGVLGGGSPVGETDPVEGHDHLGRRLVHPHRDAGGAGGCPAAGRAGAPSPPGRRRATTARDVPQRLAVLVPRTRDQDRHLGRSA